MAKTQAMLPAELAEVAAPAEDLDELLTTDELAALSLFGAAKKPPSFEKFPGTTLLRRCRQGRILCRQGEAGATAFYILTSADVLRLREKQLETVETLLAARRTNPRATGGHPHYDILDNQDLSGLEQEYREEIAALRTRVAASAGGDEKGARRHVISVHLLGELGPRPAPGGFWSRLVRGLTGRATSRVESRGAIPIDAPVDIDAASGRAPLHEGELFGEMSCMNRAPRSGTVVAEEDCYLLEMLRNVLEMVRRDPAQKERMDADYRARAMTTHLLGLDILKGLRQRQAIVARLREVARLEVYDAGAVVFEEHDAPDGVYVIRSGLVKVIKNVGCALRADEFDDARWLRFCHELGEAASRAGDPLADVVEAIPERPRAEAVAAGAAGQVAAELRTELLAALNAFIRQGKIPVRLGKTTADVAAALKSRSIELALENFPEACENWSQLEGRIFRRLFLETACPAGIPQRAATNPPPRTEAYLGRGDVIGEMGVMLSEPRGATCIAYDHPDGRHEMKVPDSRTGAVPSQLELVKIARDDFQSLVGQFPELRERIEKIIRQRRGASAAAQSVAGAFHSPEFDRLGLVQGQSLMLIDLDRCTRCGSCVEACVHSHDDGQTRLYLDGPRFGKYQVPLSCRRCRDPVCLIGCPVGAINRGEQGEIRIAPWCIGCRSCADQCPYGSIQMVPLVGELAIPAARTASLGADVELKSVSEQAVVCDLCASTPAGDPNCVYACPHDAALRVDAAEFFQAQSAEGALRGR